MRNLTVYIAPEFKNDLPGILGAIRMLLSTPNCIHVCPIEMNYTEISINGYHEELAEIEKMLSPFV